MCRPLPYFLQALVSASVIRSTKFTGMTAEGTDLVRCAMKAVRTDDVLSWVVINIQKEKAT